MLRILVPLLLALVLLALAHLVGRYPGLIPTKGSNCHEGILCVMAGDVMRDLASLKFDLKRSPFSKKELPILSIYLSNGALKKLDAKRRSTLQKPGQILLIEDEDWVSARIIVDDGDSTVKSKARLRLKGDWSDHINHPSKMSFRIKIKAPNYVLGMRRFSIQHPKTRNFQAEPLLLDEMRRWGILTPRYRFVDVRINDYRIGIMALEEHYAKELLEAQQRREGPIVVLDENAIWRQRDLNHRVNAPQIQDFDVNDIHVAHWDLAIRQFRQPTWAPGTTATNNSVRALSLYRDYIDGRVRAAEIFDLPKMARWWVLTNIWNGCHSTAAHNRRFYFNPTTNLLEPISFDNLPVPLKYPALTEPCGKLVIPYLRDDANFQRYVLDFSETLLLAYQDPDWQRQFRLSQSRLMEILTLEKMRVRRVLASDLLGNLAHFLRMLEFSAQPRVVNTSATRSFIDKYPSAGLYSQVRAFLYPTAAGMVLELKNLSAEVLSGLQVGIVEDDVKQLLPAVQNELPPRRMASSDHVLVLDIDQPYTAATQVMVGYQYRGDRVEVPAVVQFRGHDTGFSGDLRVLAENPGVVVNAQGRTLRLEHGHLRLQQNLILPRGWSLELMPGTRLSLLAGATLKLRGPLRSVGTQQRPVLVDIAPDPNYRGIGAWGGILVAQSEQPSLLSHTKISGAGDANLSNRQDYFGITGCVSFYESDVDVIDSSFIALHCEDALNIVRSRFLVERTRIDGSRADGFDSDFSTGTVADSRFENIGNDGVDVSGTSLIMRDTHFASIGDKAVSVGEESQLIASGLEISGATSGIASKDLSRAEVVGSRFSAISGSALITYVKKGEYGGATLDCKRCVFLDTVSVATNQQGSKIVIDDVYQPVTDFNRNQLAEAGYVLSE